MMGDIIGVVGRVPGGDGVTIYALCVAPLGVSLLGESSFSTKRLESTKGAVLGDPLGVILLFILLILLLVLVLLLLVLLFFLLFTILLLLLLLSSSLLKKVRKRNKDANPETRTTVFQSSFCESRVASCSFF